MSRRAGLVACICFVAIALLGAASGTISQAFPGLLNIAVPLVGLLAIIASVTCIVAAVCERMGRNANSAGLGTEVHPGKEKARAFWFILTFMALGFLATILDRQIQTVPSISGIGRTFGPLSSLIGTIVCAAITVRSKDYRFLFVGAFSLALLVYWVGRIRTEL